jgi:diguanylate cyclase
MIDIDYFKSFNDTYGHAVGDQALQMVARVLRNRLRTGDMVARYGGEEFVVALPETPAQQAVATGELLRGAVAATQLRVAGVREPIGVTISVGVASWPDRGNMITRLVQTADDRLYEAKLGGRDRVIGSTPVSDPDESIRRPATSSGAKPS